MKLLTLSEAANILRTTKPTLSRWHRAGHLIAQRLPNGRFLIPESEIERLTGAGADRGGPPLPPAPAMSDPDDGDGEDGDDD